LEKNSQGSNSSRRDNNTPKLIRKSDDNLKIDPYRTVKSKF